ncbi:MAG: hypothetical protein RLZZ488_1762 [Pseudomonadota bacterium]|jgi:hypothetical protein
MTARWTHWLTYATLATTFGFVLSSSCARQPIESLEEPNEEITVSGAFADWSPTANSFSNGMFVLLDSATNEVFTGDISSNSFKIEKVPAQGKYYGLLIGPDFQVRGLMQKSAPVGELKYYIFRMGQTGGNLGTLVVSDGKANSPDVLETSQQSELDFQTTLGASEKLAPFKADYSTNFQLLPDIDGDAIPNMLDTDVDGDAVENIYDAQTYSDKSPDDAKIPWQHNYSNGIPKMGFLKCDQLRKAADPSFEFWCVLKLPAGLAEKVTLKSFGVETEMFDDGGKTQATHGDPTAGDGVWNARFTLSTGQGLFPEQLVMATVTLASGGTKKYLTPLGPEFNHLVSFQMTTENKPEITITATKIDAKVLVTNCPTTGSFPSGVKLEIQILNADGSFLKSFREALGNCGETTDGIVFKHSLEESFLDFGLKEGIKYRFKARIIGPAALPGLVGSASESAVTDEIQFPTPTTPD